MMVYGKPILFHCGRRVDVVGTLRLQEETLDLSSYGSWPHKNIVIVHKGELDFTCREFLVTDIRSDFKGVGFALVCPQEGVNRLFHCLIELEIAGQYTGWTNGAPIDFPETVSLDEVAVWEHSVLMDPFSAGPYSDWCEEHGWVERADRLREELGVL